LKRLRGVLEQWIKETKDQGEIPEATSQKSEEVGKKKKGQKAKAER
jgi:hypothetical protein